MAKKKKTVKRDTVGRPWSVTEITYLDIAAFTGLSYNAVRQHVSRRTFNPEKFDSVVKFCVRHSSPAKKAELLSYVFSELSPELHQKAPATKA